MADSMEGVVATADQAKPENVEEKAIQGEPTTCTTQHAFYLAMSLRPLHDIMARPQDVSQSHDCHGPGVLQVSVPAG
jgi:hypothetical protein